MKYNIRGEKIDITPAMKEFVEEKISKLEKYFDNTKEIEVNVLAKVKGLNQTVEVTMLTNKFTLRAEESSEDFYSSVDLVIAKLERQIRKNKDRLHKKYKNVEHKDFNFEYEVAEEEKEEQGVIVKRKNIEAMKPMDEEEAILQIELLNHDFFVFKNIDEDCISLLYKRKDSNYGIINLK